MISAIVIAIIITGLNMFTFYVVYREGYSDGVQDAKSTTKGFDTIKQEALRYLSQGTDYFTVSAGPWTLTFDKKEVSDDKNN